MDTGGFQFWLPWENAAVNTGVPVFVAGFSCLFARSSGTGIKALPMSSALGPS